MLENEEIKLVASQIENNKSYVHFDVIEKSTKNIIFKIYSEEEDLLNGITGLQIKINYGNEEKIKLLYMAIKIFIKFIFYSFPIHKVTYTTLESNILIMKTLEKVGFKVEANLKQDTFKDGEYQDKLIMGILR